MKCYQNLKNKIQIYLIILKINTIMFKYQIKKIKFKINIEKNNNQNLVNN